MAAIKAYETDGQKVCMIGDGVNDALALRSAYAGVAMGGIGSDIAVESSDAVLVRDDIGRIPYLIKLSRRAIRTIQINIVFSLGLNALAVILSALGILNPVFGAIVHNLGSVAVVVHSAMLLRTADE